MLKIKSMIRHKLQIINPNQKEKLSSCDRSYFNEGNNHYLTKCTLLEKQLNFSPQSKPYSKSQSKDY